MISIIFVSLWFIAMLLYVGCILGSTYGLPDNILLSKTERRMLKRINKSLDTIKIDDVQIDQTWTPLNQGYTAIKYVGDGFKIIEYMSGLIAIDSTIDKSHMVGDLNADHYFEKLKGCLSKLKRKYESEWTDRLNDVHTAIHSWDVNNWKIRFIDRINLHFKHSDRKYKFAAVHRDSVNYIMNDDRFTNICKGELADCWDADEEYITNKNCKMIGYTKTENGMFPVAIGPDDDFDNDKFAIDFYYKDNK